MRPLMWMWTIAVTVCLAHPLEDSRQPSGQSGSWPRGRPEFSRLLTERNAAHTGQSHVRSLHPFSRRDGPRPLCRPDFVNIARRGLADKIRLLLPSNSTPDQQVVDDGDLFRRVMTLPGSTQHHSVEDFMETELQWATNIVFNDRVSTAVYRPFFRQALSLGVSGLCGCTALAIISRNAAYMAHYFENISFNPDEGPNGVIEEANVAFQRTVIDALRNGIAGQQPSLTSLAARLQGGRAFLVVPTEGPGVEATPDPYRDMWNQIKETVRQITGIVVKEVPYEALDEEDPTLTEGARGKVLLKFDPLHQEESPQHLAKIWVENAEVYSDAW